MLDIRESFPTARSVTLWYAPLINMVEVLVRDMFKSRLGKTVINA